MACETDSYTKRARTSNDPYTLMTEEQIRNVARNPSTLFHLESTPKPKESKEGRNFAKRYSHMCSQSLVRDLERTCDDMCIDEQIRQPEITPARETSLGTSAVKGSTMKLHCRPLNCSSAPRSCRDALADDTRRKTTAEYKEVIDEEKRARLARRDQWPEYSTYTATMLLKEKLKVEDKNEVEWEAKKRHAALGQRLQAEEQEKRQQKLQQRNKSSDPPSVRKVVVFATPSSC